jgi:uncharacterized protein with beta-barrel porin domain
MKRHIFIAAAISLLLASPVRGQETKEKQSAKESNEKAPAPETGGSGHSHFTKIPPTVQEIWSAIYKQQAQLKETVDKKDLGEAHDHAFAIRDLVKALPSKISSEKKAKAEEASKTITKLAAEIDKAAAARALKATEAKVIALEAAIKDLADNVREKEPAKK